MSMARKQAADLINSGNAMKGALMELGLKVFFLL